MSERGSNSKETEYFGQVGIDGEIFGIFRNRTLGDLRYHEVWSQGTAEWKISTLWLRLMTGGDCTLKVITISEAKRAFPKAFEAQSPKSFIASD